MQLNSNSTFLLNDNIDSIGSIYCQPFNNQLLDTQILKIGYINYSQKKLNTQVSEKEKVSKNFALKFEYTDFVFIILLLMLGLLAYVKLSGKNYFNRLFMSITNYSYSVSFFKEKNLAFALYHYILMFIFYISTGLLVSIIADYYGYHIPHTNKQTQLLILILVCAFILIINRLSTRLSGWVFGFNKLSLEYLFYYGNLLKIFGLLMMILSLVLFFLDRNHQTILIYFSFFVGSIIYLVKSFRIFVIFFSNGLSLYYLILYFCALEIIPIILLVKFFTVLINKGFISIVVIN